MAAMTATPPTTPPTIGPTGVDLCVGPLDEPCDGECVADVECVLLVDVGLPIVREKILFRFVLLNPPAGEVAVAPPDPLQNYCQHFRLHGGVLRGK